MPFCENCGNKVSDTSKFCSNCGEKVNYTAQASEIQPEETKPQWSLEKFLEEYPPNEKGIITCPRCMGKGNVDNDDINRLTMEHYWMPGECLYCDGVGLVNIKKIHLLNVFDSSETPMDTKFKLFSNTSTNNNSINQYDSDGLKQGEWTEYLNIECDKEVPSSDANIMRKINYQHGMPVDKVRDYYYPSRKLQSEFELISGLYNRYSVRPLDKYYGILLLFEEESGAINGIQYYDENGKIDIRKVIDIAYPTAKQDSRFDENIFRNSEFGQKIIDEFIKKVNIETLIEVIESRNGAYYFYNVYNFDQYFNHLTQDYNLYLKDYIPKEKLNAFCSKYQHNSENKLWFDDSSEISPYVYFEDTKSGNGENGFLLVVLDKSDDWFDNGNISIIINKGNASLYISFFLIDKIEQKDSKLIIEYYDQGKVGSMQFSFSKCSPVLSSLISFFDDFKSSAKKEDDNEMDDEDEDESPINPKDGAGIR